MAYQGSGVPGQDGQHAQGTYHLPPARDYDSDDDAERKPLNASQGPYQHGPFDDRAPTPGSSSTGYTLTDSPYDGGQQNMVDPTVSFGVPRAPSPYDRSTTSSTEAWRERQAPTGLKRYGTRKIRLQQQVLSIDYPVPSAIQNAVQSKYRHADVEGGSEEFTHMRCTSPRSVPYAPRQKSNKLPQTPPPLAIPMISPSRMDTICARPCITAIPSC